MKTIFITGAAGVIGSSIAEYLLKKTDNSIVLLLRAHSKEHLEERISSLAAFWGLSKTALLKNKRIVLLAGDLSQKKFGLSNEQYKQLSYRVTHIIHSAGHVKLSQTLSEARANSVSLLENVLSFVNDCKHHEFKKVEYISTIGVAGKAPGTIPEKRLYNKHGFNNYYEQAKYECEERLFQEIEEGIPITIHRPSMVVGDSKSGKIINFQIFYYLCEYFSGAYSNGILPDTKLFKLDIIPSDYISKAVTISMDDDLTVGQIFHLCSGNQHAIILNDLNQLVEPSFQSQSKKQPFVIKIPIDLMRLYAKVAPLWIRNTKRKKALAASSYFLPYMKNVQIFNTIMTEKYFKEKNILIPNPKDYITPILSYYMHHKK
ncbi:MAG: SDR family oxidoreductase [Verrucomicrobiota bacterium]